MPTPRNPPNRGALPRDRKDFHRLCGVRLPFARLEAFQKLDLAAEAKRVVADVPADRLARAAAFLLVKDSRSSFAIEGEHPPHDRIQRWGQAIAAAGRRAIDIDELIRLQRIVSGDARFVRLGLRKEGGGFVGGHDRETRAPLPEHVSARHEDLSDLIDGLAAFDSAAARVLDPVIAAAALAFRARLHLPLRGRQRAASPLPDPSRADRTRLQSAGDRLSRFRRDPRPHRRLSRHARELLGSAAAPDPVGTDRLRQCPGPE